MPDPLDTASTFQEMPSLHGEGSQTPPDPSKATGAPTPIGSGKPITPAGKPGAPPMGGAPGGAGMLGAKPGAPKPPAISPEEQLNYDSLDTLRQDITRLMRNDEIEDLDSLVDRLLNEDWRVERITDLMDFRNFSTVQELFQDALSKSYKEEEEKKKQMGAPPPAGGTPPGGMGGIPIEPPKKPDNDLTGQNMPKPEANTKGIIKEGVDPLEASTKNLNVRSGLMKKVLLKDGTLVVKEAASASEVIEGISSARRRVEALIDDYKDAYLRHAGLEALKKEGMGPFGDMGPGGPPGGPDIGGGLDLGGPDMGEPDLGGVSGLEDIVGALKDAIQKLTDWLSKGKDTKKDEALPAADAGDLEDEMGKAKEPMDKAKGILSGPPKKKDEDSEDKDKDKDKKEEAGTEGDTKQAVAGDAKGENTPVGSDAPMKVTMGETKPPGDSGQTSKEKTQMKDGEGGVKKADLDEVVETVVERVVDDATAPTETTPDPAPETTSMEAAPEGGEGDVAEPITAATIVDQLETRLAELKKEANLYPFKDLNKQQVDPINAQTASDQASTINTEISGGNHATKEPQRGETLAPGDISTTNPTVGQGNPSEAPNSKTVNAPAAGKVSVEVAEKIRQSSVENERAKAKLSVELACQQQLKGLIDNPLRVAMVKNMIEAGIAEASAEAIAFNSFLDGYEESQKLVMKEAFEEFMTKDIDEFIKIAKVTKEHRVKEGSQASVENVEEGTRNKTASLDSAPLRGSQPNKGRKEDYSKYWTDVARERRNW